MKSVLYWILLIAAWIKQGILQNNRITLSSSKEVVLENTSVALTCSTNTERQWSSLWESSLYDNKLAQCLLLDHSCRKTSFLTNNSLFDCICNDDRSYTVHLKHVDRFQHSSTWTCKTLNESSNTVVINVSVPVTHAILTQSGSVHMYENTSVTFTCTSSYSLPSAQIQWYRNYRLSTVEITNSRDVEIKRETHTSEGNVIRVTETLTSRFTRSMNGWMVYCTVSNRQSIAFASNIMEISVIYPPDMHPVIHGFSNGTVYRLIEHENGNLSCSVTGGNPLAKPEWYCERIISKTLNERITGNETVTSYLSWNAKRADRITCFCITGHVLSNVSIYINIDVLYPPGIPSILLQHQSERKNITSDIKLIEHKSYYLLCSADANPPPLEYIWDGPQTPGTAYNSPFDFQNVKRSQNGTYTCHARNIMRPTYGENSTQENNNIVNVDILFKPILAFISGQEVAEGSIFFITCEVISSNPSDIYFTWTRDTGDVNRNSKVLVLHNITRHDAMNYTCTAKNYMEPTIGEDEEGHGSETFYLNVLYRASVTMFVVNGYEQDVYIIKESNTITLTCEADSNPASTIKIITPNGTEVIAAGTNFFSYSLYLSSCVDNGTYTCSASNYYNNGQPGVGKLAVFVKCTPIGYHHIESDIRSKLYVPVTLTFRAVAYPEPEFTWEKWVNSSWHKITNDSMFSISSFKLQSNLTVINFTTTTPNVYRLIAENEIGRLIQNYTLKSFDYSKETQRGNSPPVAGIVIGVLSVLVLAIVVAVFIVLLRRYKKTRNRDTKERSYENLPEMRTVSGGKDTANHEPHYEGLRPDAERGTNERKEQAYEILNLEHGGHISNKDTVDAKEWQTEKGPDGAMNPVYTNLKL